MKYITKQEFQNSPENYPGEINEEPTMTIEGEYMEMKDILNYAKRGGDIPKTDTQYFRPDEIQQINSLYKASLDLTDIDALRKKTSVMQTQIQKAHERKLKDEAELKKAMEENKAEEEKKSKPKKQEE